MIDRLLDTLARHRWIAPLFTFCATLAIASWFWPNLGFVDGDSFYHIKMTELLAHGIVRDFPWLPFTTFATNYIDHHFLYHVTLLPLITLLGPAVGMKLASALLTAGAITMFYVVVRGLGFRAPGFFTFVLALSSDFFFRETLAKAPAFSLIFLLLGVLLIAKQKPVSLAILAFAYVWAYDGWPLLPAITVIWILSRSLLLPALTNVRYSLHVVFHEVIKPTYRNLFLGVSAGTIFGILINPYFPKNLSFYITHIIQIGLVNYQSQIAVGNEWHPVMFSTLIAAQPLLFILVPVSLVAICFAARRLSAARLRDDRIELLLSAFALTIIAGLLLVETLRSKRNVDYSLPFLALAVAAFSTIGSAGFSELFKTVHQYISGWRRLLLIPISVAMLALVTSQVYFIMHARESISDGYNLEHYAAPDEWLKKNTPPQSIIFHTNWDTFPLLFYGNDQNRYIIGMDSTFFYAQDPVRYDLWYKIVYGEYVGDAINIIEHTFNSSYVFLDKGRDHDSFEKQLRLSPLAHVVYGDEVALIFKLDPTPTH